MRQRTAVLTGALSSAVLAAALWWRRHPSACPYSQRFWVQAPHPFITRERLRETLQPRPGERILEVGPGTGYYSLPVAGWLEPGGTLELVDLQRKMLDHVGARASSRGISNVRCVEADAQRLPFEKNSFDAAFLTAVLGEIPDQSAALAELHRVIRPGGRLVVGELFGDPHWVSFRSLRRRAEATGLEFEVRSGGPLGYFGRFGKPR